MSLIKKQRELLINIGVLFVTLSILTFIGEVFLRVTMIQPIKEREIHIHQPSSVKGLVYEFIPSTKIRGYGLNTVTIGSHGWRSPELDPKKSTIAVLGDSFVFGYGVDNDETNPAYIQKHFSEYNVLNTGVNGYNIEQEALVYDAKIASLEPELVILEFTFNDMDKKGYFDEDGIIRVGHKTKEEAEEITKKDITRKGLINFPGKYYLQTNSAIFNFVERKTKWLPFRKSFSDVNEERINEEHIMFYEKWFNKLSASIETKNKLLVIWPEYALHTNPREELRRMAEDNGWIVLDLYDVFGNKYKSLGWDYHPHPKTQKKAANLIIKSIEEHGLLE
jgi:lysophospholipase L1-like esterase